MPSHVRDDEVGLGMPGEEAIAFGHQLFERREARAIRIPAVRIERQLEPALVVEVDRLEELGGIGRVDVHGDLQARAGLPDRIELGIVELQAGPVGLLRGQPEVLHDLAEALRPGLDVLFDLLRRTRAESGADRIAEVDGRERRPSDPDTDSSVMTSSICFRRSPDVPDTFTINWRFWPSIALTTASYASGVTGPGPPNGMAVNVHDRKLRARHRVLRDDKRRARFVVANAGRRKFGFPPFGWTRAKLSGCLSLPRRGHGKRNGNDERRAAAPQTARRWNIKGSQRAVSRILFPAVAPCGASAGRRPFL